MQTCNSLAECMSEKSLQMVESLGDSGPIYSTCCCIAALSSKL